MELLSAPLDPPVGFMLILVGAYSLYFNVNDAKRKNHRSSERAARIGGWFYIITGAGIIITKSL
jgi:hypothetical protein